MFEIDQTISYTLKYLFYLEENIQLPAEKTISGLKAKLLMFFILLINWSLAAINKAKGLNSDSSII